MPQPEWYSGLLYLRYTSAQSKEIDELVQDYADARKPADWSDDIDAEIWPLERWYDIRWMRAQILTKLNRGWSREVNDAPPVAFTEFKAWLETSKVRIM